MCVFVCVWLFVCLFVCLSGCVCVLVCLFVCLFVCVRVGACAMTTRKLVEEDFEQIGVFLHEALQIALKIQEQSGPKLVDFVKCLQGNEDIAALRKNINRFSAGFPMPGFEPKENKYQLEA